METPDSLKQLIRGGFNDLHYLEVTDESDGCGAKFKAIIVSDSFDGVVSVLSGSLFRTNFCIVLEPLRSPEKGKHHFTRTDEENPCFGFENLDSGGV